ncbi:hypothetical protein EKD04_017975 [Chloroflexales bacterium ZM16-3]|nr:hypothetical protein [Chloroflexales bacterium ZM16-3]
MIGTIPVVLLLEDERPGQALVRALRQRGINRLPGGESLAGQVVRGADLLRAVERLQGTVDGVILDYHVAGVLTGVDVAAHLRTTWPDMIIVLLTGALASARQHARYRPDLFDAELAKPQLPDHVADAVVALLRERRGWDAPVPEGGRG